MLIPPDKKNEDESSPSSPAVVRASHVEGYHTGHASDAGAAASVNSAGQGEYPNLQVYAAAHDQHNFSASSASGRTGGEDASTSPRASESTHLLAPPPYQPTSGHGSTHAPSPYGAAPTGGKPPRQRLRMRFLAAGCAALVLLVLGAAVASVIGRLVGGSGGGSGKGGKSGGGGMVGEPMPPAGEPVHGGRGSTGRWDEDWTPSFPIFANETSPRYCDAWSRAVILPKEEGTYNGEPRLSRETSFRLPVRAERVYLHARGRGVAGQVDVTHGEARRENGERDEVVVEVEVRYALGREVMGWHVCRVGDDAQAGVVIVMPEEDTHDVYSYHDVSFRVHIDYPLGGSTVEHIGALDLAVHNMRVSLGSLARAYAFSDVAVATSNGRVEVADLASGALNIATSNGRIEVQRVTVPHAPSLRTSNGAIRCEHCCADKAEDRADRWDLRTTNGPILGHFCAKDMIQAGTTSGSISGTYEAPAIVARTTNGGIEGHFLGITDGGVELRTTTGRIDAKVEIVREGAKHDAGDAVYRVPLSAITTNAAVDVQLTNLPLDTFLDAKIHSTNGAVSFVGHPHFQGDFVATTSLGRIDVKAIQSAPGSPERMMKLVGGPSAGGRRIAGDIVFKGEKRAPEELGLIDARTTNSGITLRL